ncbi:MAG: hypothetical protein DI603_20565 [Roseateles depolymerans]|uniref:YqjK-like protein n=1 Tax=Roseateles depolymerans TaxID=76731 RepID=A0A2W5FA78_9BURK|nr:MAG: hypothetical protein DI603_20565 [Roseateles depolymerans]
MIRKPPANPAERAQRKADLLMASQLLRLQADVALDQVGQQADRWALRWQALRGWVADARVVSAAVATAGLWVGAGSRRGQLLRGLRWCWVAWRGWRLWRRAAEPPAG